MYLGMRRNNLNALKLPSEQLLNQDTISRTLFHPKYKNKK